ncbi:unnamed protein product [Diplocarpon coronariae]|nr:hypothetical protein JHW43_004477 [Diplocarpon mali]
MPEEILVGCTPASPWVASHLVCHGDGPSARGTVRWPTDTATRLNRCPSAYLRTDESDNRTNPPKPDRLGPPGEGRNTNISDLIPAQESRGWREHDERTTSRARGAAEMGMSRGQPVGGQMDGCHVGSQWEVR